MAASGIVLIGSLLASPAEATPSSYGGGCTIHGYGTPGTISMTVHIDTNTCDLPVKAWAHWNGPGWVSGTEFSGTIYTTGTIKVEVSLVESIDHGGYAYQAYYGAPWTSVQTG